MPVRTGVTCSLWFIVKKERLASHICDVSSSSTSAEAALRSTHMTTSIWSSLRSFRRHCREQGAEYLQGHWKSPPLFPPAVLRWPLLLYNEDDHLKSPYVWGNIWIQVLNWSRYQMLLLCVWDRKSPFVWGNISIYILGWSRHQRPPIICHGHICLVEDKGSSMLLIDGSNSFLTSLTITISDTYSLFCRTHHFF